ncbi:MAG TPA: hypothetical protein VJP60_06905 [Rhizomicrobium sp.]|nr:hypothetical protein [Rhizomicrobium sp.]
MTTKGMMEESVLRRVDGEIDNNNEHTTWVEYYDGEKLVHRSAHIRLKKSVFSEMAGGNFG